MQEVFARKLSSHEAFGTLTGAENSGGNGNAADCNGAFTKSGTQNGKDKYENANGCKLAYETSGWAYSTLCSNQACWTLEIGYEKRYCLRYMKTGLKSSTSF